MNEERKHATKSALFTCMADVRELPCWGCLSICCCAAGPGLAVRVLGDVTEGDALDVLRQVDEIYINTIRDFGLYDKIWQAFAVFLPVRYPSRGLQCFVILSAACRSRGFQDPPHAQHR